jgi:adenosylcobinamide kinase/adenosylcobinamide-phosphate guanylyltransferase
MSRLVLVLGGARSGKSDFAQRLAEMQSGKVIYAATAAAVDVEMAERIAAHRSSRPAGWRTVEACTDVASSLVPFLDHNPTVLLDCLTLLASNVLFAVARDIGEEAPNLNAVAGARLQGELESLLSLLSEVDFHLIIVSNEVGEGIVPANRLSRLYRDLLGRANAYLARKADTVYLMVAGLPVDIKLLTRETERRLAGG